MRRIEPYFPLSHGVPRVNDRRVVSRIIYVIRNGSMWRDAPRAYGPPKTIYNRFIRWKPLRRVQSDIRRTGGQGRQALSTDDRRNTPQGTQDGCQPAQKGRFPDVFEGPKAA
jgi:putative transposase